ncbi:hypothetical protein Pyrde_0331 [Pyrodictium delaneyi]|uniref:Metallo-beta-lactamase domain-containing protein n=1 Tax=Pyrodictium delaneyi TaxID=1273541 RepID=A0A0P0N258_9CREN|nr:MBL fold metallo-hydrolase [Pyrodictium delaneyi]ALL00381.1 hypothetical protein Pyrde_0331 [Pyrodictium delaneyi]
MEVQLVRLVTGPLETNTYVLVGPQEDCLVIDPGECIADKLPELGCRRVKAVLATHMHIDHVAGVNCLRGLGAVFAANPADKVALEFSRKLARIWGIEADWEPPEEPDVELADGTRIAFSGGELLAVHTPGHTPGHMVFILGGDVVFTGDLLFAGSVGRTDFPGGDYEELLESIRRLYSLLPLEAKIYPGHGPATTLEQEKRSNPFVVEALGG